MAHPLVSPSVSFHEDWSEFKKKKKNVYKKENIGTKQLTDLSVHFKHSLSTLFSLSEVVTFLPEGVIIGFWNFACGSNSHHQSQEQFEKIESHLHER